MKALKITKKKLFFTGLASMLLLTGGVYAMTAETPSRQENQAVAETKPIEVEVKQDKLPKKPSNASVAAQTIQTTPESEKPRVEPERPPQCTADVRKDLDYYKPAVALHHRITTEKSTRMKRDMPNMTDSEIEIMVQNDPTIRHLNLGKSRHDKILAENPECQ